MRNVRPHRLLGPALAVLVLAGCGGDPTVDRADLEHDVSSLLERQGTPPDEVTCPGDLTGRVGETMRCRVERDSEDVPVEVRVTRVDGNDVNFQIAPTLLQSTVEQKVSSSLERQVGQAPDDVRCPDDLIGRVGVKMRCTLSAGSDTIGLTVTVTSVEGKHVNFDIDVDQEKAS